MPRRPPSIWQQVAETVRVVDEGLRALDTLCRDDDTDDTDDTDADADAWAFLGRYDGTDTDDTDDTDDSEDTEDRPRRKIRAAHEQPARGAARGPARGPARRLTGDLGEPEILGGPSTDPHRRRR